MANRNRPVADRLRSLQPAPTEAHSTLAGVRRMYEAMGGAELHCTISEYCRTQVFQFPVIRFHPTSDLPPLRVYSSPSVRAHVTSDLPNYFKSSESTKQYTISPCLRHVVGETDEKVRSQEKNSVPVFLVIEEFSQLTSVAMTKGECSIADETRVLDGEKVPLLIGGREGEQCITAWHTSDGSWPQLPNNQQSVNLILAGVRVGQNTPDPIRKYFGQKCFVTDDGRFVTIMGGLTGSARLSVASPMDTTALIGRVTEIAHAISAMEQDIATPHLALLINSIYSDEHKDDPFKRLQYLQLWQAMADAAGRVLDFEGKIRKSKRVVAGKHRLNELKDYRDDIAHWWTDSINEHYLADLQRTINELIRRKYF